jgi:hypothetical protein
LFTILLDGRSGESHPKLWSIFHDFYIHSAALDVVRNHSAKLARLSDTVDSWINGPYSKVLHIINTETLHKLHDIWLKYANTSTDTLDMHKQLRQATEEVYTDDYCLADPENEHGPVTPVTSSFGMMAMSYRDVAFEHMIQYWGAGAADIMDLGLADKSQPICIPLIVFSSVAGDRFAVRSFTTPLAIFHLAHAATSDAQPQRFGSYDGPTRAEAKQAVAEAKKQFKNWSKAFNNLSKPTIPSSSGLRLRIH